MSDAPMPRMVRRADALRMLAPYGVSESEFDKMIEAEVIDRLTLHAGGRGYYIVAQLRRIVIEPLEIAERLALEREAKAKGVRA